MKYDLINIAVSVSRQLVCLGLLLSLFCGCGESETKSNVSDRISDSSKPLIFLTHPTMSPACHLDDNGQCAGTDVELAKKIASRMGRKLEVQAVNFEELIPRLKVGAADFAIATITITEARKRDVDFSLPYEVSGNCFLYRADGPVPKMSKIANLSVAVEMGTTADIYLCKHGGDPDRYANLHEAVIALEQGKVDAVLFDRNPLLSWEKRSNGKFKTTLLVTREGYGVAVDKRRKDILAVANAVVSEGGAK